MSSESYHEREDLISEATKNMHRAIVSLKEELDAVDWYQQRADACSDDDLKSVLLHNKDEEIEHAMMVLEWIRRHDGTFDAQIGNYIHSTGPIVQVEKQANATAEGGAGAVPSGPSARAPSPSLGIGSLKGAK
jgi:ferritin-like protein